MQCRAGVAGGEPHQIFLFHIQKIVLSNLELFHLRVPSGTTLGGRTEVARLGFAAAARKVLARGQSPRLLLPLCVDTLPLRRLQQHPHPLTEFPSFSDPRNCDFSFKSSTKRKLVKSTIAKQRNAGVSPLPLPFRLQERTIVVEYSQQVTRGGRNEGAFSSFECCGCL